MSILRCFLPKVLLVALFLSVAILPLLERDARTAADPLTPEERAFVAAHGPIRYAPDPQFPPFEFLDSSGVARGITPDLLAIMGKKLGVEFRTVAYPTWSDVLEAVKRGEVDLLGTLTRTPEREGFLLFSRPYLSVPYVLFVRQDGGDPKTIEDMVSRRLGVVRNYGINTWLSAEHPEIHPVAVEDTATGLTMVATGQLDAMLETLPVGARIVREKSLTNIRIVPRHIYTLPQHFGVRKEEPLLLSIVQKGLDSADRDGSFRGVRAMDRTGFFTPSPGDLSASPERASPSCRGRRPFLGLDRGSEAQRPASDAIAPGERGALPGIVRERHGHDLYARSCGKFHVHQQGGGANDRLTPDEALKSNITSVLAPAHLDLAPE